MSCGSTDSQLKSEFGNTYILATKSGGFLFPIAREGLCYSNGTGNNTTSLGWSSPPHQRFRYKAAQVESRKRTGASRFRASHTF